MKSLLSIGGRDVEKPEKAGDSKVMPTGPMPGNEYALRLSDYFDTYDPPWHDDAVEAHKENILLFVEYAEAVGAKLLFIDRNGVLQHSRFGDLRAAFDESENLFYYDPTSGNYGEHIT